MSEVSLIFVIANKHWIYLNTDFFWKAFGSGNTNINIKKENIIAQMTL